MCFPAEESGKNHNLSKYGPYHVTALNSPDVTVAKVHYSQDRQITIHQSRINYYPAAAFIVMVASRRD